MSADSATTTVSAAARLLARERHIAALESGRDLLLDYAAPGEQLACIHGPLLSGAARVGLVIVPDPGHALCLAARAPGLPAAAAVVAPDMSDADRRDLGIALRNQAVQLLLVTPDRLRQPKFVQFIGGLRPAYAAVASCQRILPDAPDYLAAYESCRALRGLFPDVPLLALADGPQAETARRAIAAALGIHDDSRPESTAAPALVPPPPPPLIEPTPPALPVVAPAPPAPRAEAPAPRSETPAPRAEAPAPRSAPPAPKAALPRRAPVSEAHRAAFEHFEREQSVTQIAAALDRDELWVYDALAAYIRHTGRTHPFPWVDKPTYLRVAMIAGQAESTDPRLIKSLLKGAVPDSLVMLVLAALENRNR